MTNELNTFIDKRTKEQIEALLEFFGKPFRRSSRKCELGDNLQRLLSEDTLYCLDKLGETDLKLLNRLCEKGAEVTVTMIRPDYPSIIEVLHLVEVSYISEDEVEMHITKPVYDLVSPLINEVIGRKESDGTFDVERLVLGCLNFYGVVPLRTFIDKVFQEEDTDEKAIIISERIASNPIMRLCQKEYKGEYYVVSPFVKNFEEIMEMRRITFKSIRKYAAMTKREGISCGSFAPNCAYGLETDEGQNLIDMLTSIGYFGEDLEFQLHSIWVSSQYALDEEATEILFRPVTDVLDKIESFSRFRQCISTIIAYSNKVPKWLLKGHNANDTGLMKLTDRIADLEDEYTGPLDFGPIPEELEQFRRLGMFVTPVDPFAPCPCGSGFSYIYCHGRKERLS